MSKLIEKIEQKLVELGLVKAAEEVVVEEDVEVGNVIVGEIKPTPISISYSAIGAPVMQTVDGEETVVEDGIHLITDGTQTMVIESGKLVKIEKVEEVPEEEAEEEVALKEETPEVKAEETEETKDEVKEEVKEEVKLEETKEEVTEEETPKTETPVVEAEVELSETDLKMAVKLRAALSNIDIQKAGSYYISLEVDEDLNVTYGAMSSSTYESLILAEEDKIELKLNELTTGFETKLTEQKEKFEGVIEALKTGETKPKKDSTSTEVKLSKAEVIKLQIAEKRKNNSNN